MIKPVSLIYKDGSVLNEKRKLAKFGAKKIYTVSTCKM